MQFVDILNTASKNLADTVMSGMSQQPGVQDLQQSAPGMLANNTNSWNPPPDNPNSFMSMVWGPSNFLQSFSGIPSPTPSIPMLPTSNAPAASAAPTPAASPAATPTIGPPAPAATPGPSPAPTPAATPAATPEANSVVNYARSAIGTPYLWGGETPNVGFDCSGLVQWAYGKMGKALPRTAADQFNATSRVDYANLQAGDLVFFQGTDGPGISHVGIYLGSGQMINAPTEGQAVQVMNLNTPYWQQHYAGGGRVQ